jgi:hypothetical protein
VLPRRPARALWKFCFWLITFVFLEPERAHVAAPWRGGFLGGEWKFHAEVRFTHVPFQAGTERNECGGKGKEKTCPAESGKTSSYHENETLIEGADYTACGAS